MDEAAAINADDAGATTIFRSNAATESRWSNARDDDEELYV